MSWAFASLAQNVTMAVRQAVGFFVVVTLMTKLQLVRRGGGGVTEDGGGDRERWGRGSGGDREGLRDR